MMYFSQKPSPPPKTEQEIDQAKRLLDFRTKFPGEGLWWVYSKSSEFRNLAHKHIIKFT